PKYEGVRRCRKNIFFGHHKVKYFPRKIPDKLNPIFWEAWPALQQCFMPSVSTISKVLTPRQKSSTAYGCHCRCRYGLVYGTRTNGGTIGRYTMNTGRWGEGSRNLKQNKNRVKLHGEEERAMGYKSAKHAMRQL
ncbi:unnamed protein product, partial [Ectocarpus fasciculatus]